MKEIKFRVWDNEKKRMSKEVPVYTPIVRWSDGDIDMPTDFGLAKSHRFTFLQYTGLKDRLGKEIYEGDILCVIDEDDKLQYSVCEYGTHRRDMASGWTVDIPGFAFVKKDGFKSFPIVKNYVGGHDLDIMEVAGNIYQNPSLIDKSTKNK